MQLKSIQLTLVLAAGLGVYTVQGNENKIDENSDTKLLYADLNQLFLELKIKFKKKPLCVFSHYSTG